MNEETDAWSSRTLLGLGNVNLDVWEGNTNRHDAMTFLTIADHTPVGVGVIHSSPVGTDRLGISMIFRQRRSVEQVDKTDQG